MDRPKRSSRNEKPVYTFHRIADFKREVALESPSISSSSSGKAKPQRTRKLPVEKELSYLDKLKLHHPQSSLHAIASALKEVGEGLQLVLERSNVLTEAVSLISLSDGDKPTLEWGSVKDPVASVKGFKDE